MGFTDVDSDNKPISFQQIFEAKRSAHLEQLQQDEDEMRQMFVVRVKEKEIELKDMEREVRQRHCGFNFFNVSSNTIGLINVTCFCSQLQDRFDKLKRQHAEEKKQLEDNRKKYEEDVLEFNRRKQQFASIGHHTLTLGKSKKK